MIKGAHIAIDVARRTGIGLDIAGDTKFTNEPEYAHRIIDSCDGRRIIFHGELAREKTVGFYRTRRALLNTINWREPFGMVPVEAMACGTPVVALARGSMPEIIWDGITGFVCPDVESMIHIIKSNAVMDIDPEDCRAWVEWRFSAQAMARRYEKLCSDLMDGREW